MTQYAGNAANFPIDFTIVSDNTDRTASSVNVALTALGDRTAWTKAHLVDGLLGGTYAPSSPLSISNLGTLSGSGPLTLTGDIFCDDLQADTVATNQITMPDGGVGVGHEFGTTYARINTDLQFKSTGRITTASPRSATLVLQNPFYADHANWKPILGSTFQNLALNTRCWAALPTIPRTFTITLVRAYVRGATGHVGLPATKFAMSLVRVDKSTGLSSSVFTNTQDPSASTGAYEVYHNFAISGSHVYTPATHRYYVEFTAESGANALAGFELYMVEVIGTYSVIGE